MLRVPSQKLKRPKSTPNIQDALLEEANQANQSKPKIPRGGALVLVGEQKLVKNWPSKKVKVQIVTWNMNCQIPNDIKDFKDIIKSINIAEDKGGKPDILVFGTQETAAETNQWNVQLQNAIGPSHVLFHSAALGMLYLSVFIRRDLIWYTSIPEERGYSTRIGAKYKTKGAVAICFMLFGTSFLFVNSHLTAHDDKIEDRVKDLEAINAMIQLPDHIPFHSAKNPKDFTDNFDCVFWAGDLNFRVALPRDEVIARLKKGEDIIKYDQMNQLRRTGIIFRKYSEMDIKFPPSYKYNLGTDDFDDVKNRTPSYCDRILYKHLPTTKVDPLAYNSMHCIRTSDHKPVWATFDVGLQGGTSDIPLSGGMFNHEVFMTALKQRYSEDSKRSSKIFDNACQDWDVDVDLADTACSIQ